MLIIITDAIFSVQKGWETYPMFWMYKLPK